MMAIYHPYRVNLTQGQAESASKAINNISINNISRDTAGANSIVAQRVNEMNEE